MKDQEAKIILIDRTATEITDFVDLLSTAGLMTAEKIYRITVEFFKNSEVQHINLHELKFFLSEAFAMRYGKVYHGFGLDILLDWFEMYWKDREVQFEKIRENEHLSFTAHEKATRSAAARLSASPDSKSNSDADYPDYKTVSSIVDSMKEKP